MTEEKKLETIDGEKKEQREPAQVFDVINDGQSLRVSTPVVHKAVYSREQLEKLRDEKTNELRNIVALLAKMDELGIA